MTVTAAGDAELDGLMLGNRANPDSEYLIMSIEASSLPAIRSSVYQVINQDGAFFPENDFFGPRSVSMSLLIRSTNGATGVREAMRALVDKAAITTTGSLQNLDIWMPGDTEAWRYIGRIRGLSFPGETETVHAGYTRCALRFDTELSTAVSVAETTSSVTYSAGSAGGWTYPKTYTYTYGATASSSVIVNNIGNYTYEPIYRAWGPHTGARIVHDDLDKELKVDGLTISSGDYLEFDVRNATIKINGSASRYAFLDLSVSEWFGLVPGNNTIRWSPASGVGSSLDVIWRSARI